jgi:prophage tail gpP-like protein
MALSLAAIEQANAGDVVSIVVNGVAYENWFDIDIDSDILNPADAFSMTVSIPKTGSGVSLSDFREGQQCKVYLGRDLQMKGVIDEVELSGDRASSRLRVTGRDLGAYLVDSEAPHIKSTKYTIKTLIEALIDPSWGIGDIIVSNDDNRRIMLGKRDKKPPTVTPNKFLVPLPRATTKIDPGQRVASIIDMHTKRLGITWWMTAGGDLFLGKPNYNQEAAYHFRAAALGSKDAKSTNVERWSVRRQIADRFSEVKVVGQGFQDRATLWSTSSGKPKFVAKSYDPDLILRDITRKIILSDGDILSNNEAQKRADYEQGRRRLSGMTISLTVPGTRQGDRLFAVDTMATVKIDEAEIDGKFYVTQRRFKEDRNKRRTELTLHEPGAWLA